MRLGNASLRLEERLLRIGVIGTGNMGGMLARAFAVTNPDATLVIYNRTVAKAQCVAAGLFNIEATTDIMNCVHDADIVFVCTKADDGQEIFRSIGNLMLRHQILATTISSIPIANLEQMTPASVAKVIPSIVQSVHSGVLLVSHGPSMPAVARRGLDRLLATIGSPFAATEPQLRVCSDISSCGPAFISELMLTWAEAAAKTGAVEFDEALSLVTQTMLGLADLLREGTQFRDVIHRVTVPGGVTETGRMVLRHEAPAIFEHLHAATVQHATQKMSK